MKGFKKIALEDLAGQNVEGVLANVTRQGGKFKYNYQDVPCMRVLKSVKIRIEKGVRWVYWYWTPQADNGKNDCGYSGVSLYENFAGSYLWVDKNFQLKKKAVAA